MIVDFGFMSCIIGVANNFLEIFFFECFAKHWNTWGDFPYFFGFLGVFWVKVKKKRPKKKKWGGGRCVFPIGSFFIFFLFPCFVYLGKPMWRLVLMGNTWQRLAGCWLLAAGCSQQPTASSQQPAASSQQSAASSQQPAASSQQPAAITFQREFL